LNTIGAEDYVVLYAEDRRRSKTASFAAPRNLHLNLHLTGCEGALIGHWTGVVGKNSVHPEMSRANPRWGAPRIHGELLNLGLDIAQRTVAKYMISRARRGQDRGFP